MSDDRFNNTKDGIGSYRISNGEKRYRVLYRLHGRRRSKGGFRTKGEAVRWRDRQRVAISEGTAQDPATQREPFGPWAEEWLENKCEAVRPSTAALYRQHYRSHIAPTFSAVAWRHLTRDAVHDWHRALKRKPAPTTTGTLSAATVAKVYRLFRQMCSAAVDANKLPTNPCRIEGAATEPATDRAYVEPPTVAQVRALAAAVGDRYRAMVLLAGFGGLRWGEVAGLAVRHVNWPDACVSVRQQLTQVDGGPPTISEPKTDAGFRTVYLHPEVMDALRQHVEAYDPTDLLFTTKTGEPLRASNWRRKVWTPATKKAGCVGVRFHDLRHTAATLAAQTGATTKDLMARMGHASHAAAMRYQHATRDRQKAIADRMALDLAPDTNVVPLRATADE